MSLSGNLATEHRLRWIRDHLEEAGQIRISAAATTLDVSEMTIRRDLQELEALGVARRVRGGAVAVGPLAFAERHRSRARAKAKIAAKLLDTIPHTGAIGFDASSTVLRLANAIEGGRDLVVLTNGWETFQALQAKPGVTAVLSGGQLDNRTGSLVGPVASKSVGSLLLTRLYVSAAAIHPDLGPSEPAMEEADVKRSFAAVAGEVILAADSSKLGGRSVARSIEWEDIALLVTELDPGDAKLAEYRDLVEIR